MTSLVTLNFVIFFQSWQFFATPKILLFKKEDTYTQTVPQLEQTEAAAFIQTRYQYLPVGLQKNLITQL